MYYRQFEDNSLASLDRTEGAAGPVTVAKIFGAEAETPDITQESIPQFDLKPLETTFKEGILTTRTGKGEWRARLFKLTDKRIQIVNRKIQVDVIEQAVQLREIESVQYPVSLKPGEETYDLANKSNYPATFGIQYIDRLDNKSKKLIAYAGSVEDCRKWVYYLRNYVSKFRDGSLEEMAQFSDSMEESGEMRAAPKTVTARVYVSAKKVWVDRKVTLEKGVLTFQNLKGKIKDKLYITHVIEFGYPSQVKGSQNPPAHIPSQKCIAFRIQTSLQSTTNCTMYIHHAEEAKSWRDSIKSLWGEPTV